MTVTTLPIYVAAAAKDQVNETCKMYGIDAALIPNTVFKPCVDPAKPKVVVGYCTIVNASDQVCKDLISVEAKRHSYTPEERDENGKVTVAEDFPLVPVEQGHVKEVSKKVKLPDTADTQAKQDKIKGDIEVAFSGVTFCSPDYKVPARMQAQLLIKFIASLGLILKPETI